MHQHYKNLLQLNCLFGNEALSGPFGATVGIVCSPFWVLEVNPSVAFVPRTANVCLFSVLSPFLAGFFNACMNLTLCRPQYSGGFHNSRGVCLVLSRKGRRKTSSCCAGRPHANSDVTIKMDSASRAPVGPQPWTLTIYGRPGI